MKTFCPICSDILLRHISHNKVAWLCLRCRQEMPNLDLIKCNIIQKQVISSDSHVRKNGSYCLAAKSSISTNTLSFNYQSTAIRLSRKREQKRLEVVSFIMHKINLILRHTLADIEPIYPDNSKQLNIEHVNTDALIKANFLKDSEAILCCICQAILFADSKILNHMILKGYSNQSFDFQFPVEQSCFIDLIKTLVIDFIDSITLDSSSKINYFALEVASYFELVIGLIIERQECYN